MPLHCLKCVLKNEHSSPVSGMDEIVRKKTGNIKPNRKKIKKTQNICLLSILLSFEIPNIISQ